MRKTCGLHHPLEGRIGAGNAIFHPKRIDGHEGQFLTGKRRRTPQQTQSRLDTNQQ